MQINPLTFVLSAFLAAPAAAATQCRLNPYELGPKGLSTAQHPIHSCAEVEKLSPAERQLFLATRRAINALPNDATDVPAIIDQGKKFLTKGELFYVNSIEASKKLAELSGSSAG